MYFGEVNETDWAQVAAAFPEYAIAMGHAAVDPTATNTTDVRHTREASVESSAGVKQKNEDTETLQEIEEVTLAGGDTIPDNIELQGETRSQLAQPDSSQLVEPDVQTPRNVTPPASPSTSRHDAPLPANLDDNGDDTTPRSPAPQPAPSPQQTPAPAPQPKPSNAPPNHAPVKTRSTKGSKPAPTQARPTTAVKEPRQHPPASPPASPNAELSDTDERKLWCVCRQPDDYMPMIQCKEPACREKWFHFACVGLEVEHGDGKKRHLRPVGIGRGEKWWCLEHRRMTDRQRKIAEEVQERAAVERVKRKKERVGLDRATERREGEKGVARVLKRRGKDGVQDTWAEGDRPAKKARKARKGVEGDARFD